MSDQENMDNLGLAANNENDVELVPEIIVPEAIDDEIDILSLNLSANNETDVEVELLPSAPVLSPNSEPQDVEMEPQLNLSLIVKPEPQKVKTSEEHDKPETDDMVELEPIKDSRRSLKNDEPERKSARLANKKGSSKEEEINKENPDGRIWKGFEKEQLLNGLKTHGSKNAKKVASYVPSKSEDNVKQNDNTEVVIDDGDQKSKKKSRKLQILIEEPNDGSITNPEDQVEEIPVRRKKNSPIEQWLEIIDNQDKEASGVNYSSILPTSLNWIAENELHPLPEVSGGIDYALIYRYLACLCQGEAPPDLDPPTAARVAGLLPMLVAIVKQMDMRKEGEWLENFRGTESAGTTVYVREEGFDGNSEAVKNMEMLSKIAGLNPLGIDAEVCVERAVPIPETICGNREAGHSKEAVI